jgi:hypothetical protein
MTNTNSNRKRRIAIAAAAIVAGGGIALAAAPAAFATGPNGSVPASITIPQTITLTMGAGSSGLTFTGTPGQASNDPTVAYSVVSNDSKGYQVQVAPSSPSMTASNGGSFSVGMIDVWGPGQAYSGANSGGGAYAGYYPASVGFSCNSAGYTVTDSSGSMSADGGDNATDTYGFIPGASINYNTSACTGGVSGPSASGAPIPANVPAGTYTDTIDYAVIGG